MLGLIKPSLMIGGFYIAWQLGILQVMLGIAGLVILAAGNVLLYVLQSFGSLPTLSTQRQR